MILEILISIIFILVIIVIQIHEWPDSRTKRMMKNIDGPPGFLCFGHTLEVARLSTADVLNYIGTLVKENGAVFKVWFLNIPNVLLNDPHYIEAALNSVHHIEKGILYEVFNSWLNEGLLISTGSKWHYRRKLLTPAFHFKILEDCLPVFNKNARRLSEELLHVNDQIIQIEPHISKCTLFIICEAAMGIELSNLPDKGEHYLQSTLRMNNINLLRTFRPWLAKEWLFFFTPIGLEYRTLLKNLHSFTNMVIKERREKRNHDKNSADQKKGKSNARTFLDCLLELNDNDPGILSTEDIREEVDTFMFEGHDTTSAAITAAIFLLGHNQEVQELVFEELNDVFGDSDRDPTMNDLNNLNYLERVIKETLRLFPSVPVISRTLKTDLILPNGGKTIPSSANVMITPFWLHRDPKYYTDPEKFDPDRFLPEEIKKRHPFSYIPFSGGPRNCIGQKFAKMELKVVLSSILRKMKIESITKQEDAKLIPAIILRPQFPFQVKFTPRKQ